MLKIEQILIHEKKKISKFTSFKDYFEVKTNLFKIKQYQNRKKK